MRGLLKLDKMLQLGYIRDIVLNAGRQTDSPPTGHVWLVLNGQVNHVTATASVLSVQNPVGVHIIASIMEIPAAIGTFVCPLWNAAAQAAGTQSQFAPTFIDDSETLVFGAAATAEAHIKVIEWKVN